MTSKLKLENHVIWKLTIPVVIGALGMIKKGNEKYLEQKPGRPNLAEMQKQRTTGTAHIQRKTLFM